MGDSYEQHWEAEMDYIGDMLGVDSDSMNDATTEAVVTPSGNEVVDAVQEVPTAYVADVDENAIPEGDVDDMYQLLQVAGIRLAIPLESVLHVYDDHVTIDEGSVDHGGAPYHVIDMINVIDPSAGEMPVQNYVLIRDRQIAIACEKVLEMVSIDDASVTWSHGNSRRRWLAGTVSSQGIALLELEQLSQMRG